MSNKRRLNDVGFVNPINIVDYLDKFPLLYKSIQAASALEKFPLPTNKEIAEEFLYNPECGIKWISDQIKSNIETYFNGEIKYITNLFPERKFIGMLNSSIQKPTDLNITEFFAYFTVYLIQLNEWGNNFCNYMEEHYNLGIEFEAEIDHKEIDFFGLSIVLNIESPFKNAHTSTCFLKRGN